MKILITGGAGFIGSHVADAFEAEGHEVVIIDDLSSGKSENVPKSRKFHQLDIRSSEAHQLVIDEKPDIINHHAAHIHVGRSVEDPGFDADVNIKGTINIMEAAKKAGSVKKVIFASTGGAMYGDKKTPFVETMKPQPLSPYGISKRSAELYLYFYYNQFSIPYIALRYANVYGPRQNPHGEAGVISIFCEKLIKAEQPVINGDGKQTRDYVFVGDVAQANLAALNSQKIGEYNIGTNLETDVNQIYQLVAKYFDSSIKAEHGPARAGEQTTSSLDFKLATTDLGWSPQIDLETGIKQTVDFFKESA